MMSQKLIGNLFPESYFVEQLCINGGEGYMFELISRSDSAVCPTCGIESHRQHTSQDRTVKDLPILGEAVTLFITQGRYYCDNRDCKTSIFTERNEFVSPYYYYTERCREYMLKIATLVSCEAASKILAYEGIKVSGDTLLNMLKAGGNAIEAKPGGKIGVDDWAYRKGQEYGTIICDLETHEIIDVLEGRDKESFEKWLRGHPNIEIVSRDRASAYASAVNTVLPEAVQIADRFHITQNLLDALNETMKTLMPEVVKIPNDEPVEEKTVNANRLVFEKKTRKRSNAKPRR